MKRKEDAFTGIEAAIVLIAFVVTASVFSYVMLSAGFFTTQKSQQITHAGVSQAASSLVIRGDIIGISSGYTSSPSNISQVQFDIHLAGDGEPVDTSQLKIGMSTSDANPRNLGRTSDGLIVPPPGSWSLYRKANANANDVLETGEIFTLIITPPGTMMLTPGTTFNIEFDPPIGAPLVIQRTIPAGITNTTLLY